MSSMMMMIQQQHHLRVRVHHYPKLNSNTNTSSSRCLLFSSHHFKPSSSSASLLTTRSLSNPSIVLHDHYLNSDTTSTTTTGAGDGQDGSSCNGNGGGGGDNNNNDGSSYSSSDGDHAGGNIFGVIIGMFLNGWRSRVAADPQFPFKVLMEEVVGVSSNVAGDMACRPNFGLNELDFVFSTLVVGAIVNFVLMYLLAPTSASASASMLPSIFCKCPSTSIFESGAHFTLAQRLGTFVFKGAQFAVVGFAAGLVGTAMTNGLVAFRSKINPKTTEDAPKKTSSPPTLLNAATWALHMGFNANMRYQSLNGVEFLLEKGLPPLGFKAYNEIAREDLLQFFLKERQLNGDLVSKTCDLLWKRDELKYVDSEIKCPNPQQSQAVMEIENLDGFLKLTKTIDWITGDETAPINNKVAVKGGDAELLTVFQIKKEMMLLTIGIGTVCSGYCLVALSLQASISYAAGVIFRIGIRSEDLENAFERVLRGSAMALSSPRLVIPAAIYGIYELSYHSSNDYFSFQLLPAMVGIFAYKAAALVQVYRDNEDLKLIFPGDEEDLYN
ncbi:hypothetical protein GIB67_006747 [Kingdonia uniflora]|uniref:CGL160/ATPI domain-containing protein n=1 Tax=Kingdonia uniflora TaxID=39325 RepID=A0A7J7LYX7_9MAGN|nr:hypothetical protein GIB67_006747 [Kingdonia uniflora]